MDNYQPGGCGDNHGGGHDCPGDRLLLQEDEEGKEKVRADPNPNSKSIV